MNTSEIKKAALFKNMNEDEVNAALDTLAAKEKKYKKGETILFAGDVTPFVGLVESGSVTIENNDIWGNRTILNRVGAGHFFAETYALLKDEPLLVDVTASEDCSIVFLRLESIENLSTLSAPWAMKLIVNMLGISLHKNLTLSSRSFHTAPKTIRERVMAYLNSVAVKKHSNEFDIPFDRQQLADYLNVERSALSKELGKMQREGLILVKKNHFIVCENII